MAVEIAPMKSDAIAVEEESHGELHQKNKALASSMGKQPGSTKRTSPSFSFGKEECPPEYGRTAFLLGGCTTSLGTQGMGVVNDDEHRFTRPHCFDVRSPCARRRRSPPRRSPPPLSAAPLSAAPLSAARLVSRASCRARASRRFPGARARGRALSPLRARGVTRRVPPASPRDGAQVRDYGSTLGISGHSSRENLSNSKEPPAWSFSKSKRTLHFR